jgi:cytochrome c-type biogenesis protein CcmH
MIAWIAFTLMVTVAAVGITIPLVRRYDQRRARPVENEVLRAQLADIDAQAADESVTPETTQTLKTETIRRFLAETPPTDAPARPLGGRSLFALAIGLAAVVAIGATLLYAKLGRPDMTAANASASSSPSADGQTGGQAAGGVSGSHVGEMIAQLEAKMKSSPNDPEGWRMLGWSYMSTGRYAEAAGAYGRASTLEPNNADYLSAQGEALTKAADGHVTADARKAFAAAAKLDPTDPRARYFLAAAKDQDGDHTGAMADWIALLKSAPPGAPWAADVRRFVVNIAQARGEDVSGKLPPAPPPLPATAQQIPDPAAGAGGPSPDQVAAAGRLPAGDQQAMIYQMVDRLAARLKANPKDPEGWVKLMRARIVLNDAAAATAAYHDAMKAFSGDAAQQAALRDQARQIGVLGA